MSQNGQSDTLDDFRYSDYEEIPVDIITFMDDPNYLGKGLINPETGKSTVFPYWREMAKKIYPDNIEPSNYNTLALSGSIGLGKSFIAVVLGLYDLYRTLCLKDPYAYYGLQQIDLITYAFINITIDAARGVAWDKCQQLLQSSPWFMSHGTVKGTTNIEWVPPKGIELVAGSQSRHIIGRAVKWCLDGQTEVLTTNGYKKLQDCLQESIQVIGVDNVGKTSVSDYCRVQKTAISSVEYQIELEDGTTLKCTPNHKLMLRDGSYKEAQELTVDDELYDLTPHGYIYKTTNKVNGKVYIGQHKGEFNQRYLGSGKLLKRAVQKYGVESFSVELLSYCLTKQELDSLEKEYIEFYDSTNINIGYNIAFGGQGGDLGPIVNQKISDYLKKHPNRSLLNKTSIIDQNGKISYIDVGDDLPKGCVTGNSISGKNKITNGVVDKYILPDDEIPQGWWCGSKSKGRKHSQCTIEKMSIAAKNRDNSKYKGIHKGYITITNGQISYQIPPDESIPEGFYRGNCYTKGPHDMSNYYSDVEMQKRKSQSLSGENNPMCGNGHKVSGGKNGKAVTNYWYNDILFECRKDLVNYLKQNVDPSISTNLIRNIERGTYSIRTINRYKYLIDSIRWEAK